MALKIAHFVHGYYPESQGGTEFYVRELCRLQRRHGHQVFVLTGSLEVADVARSLERDESDEVPLWRLHRSDLYFDTWGKAYCPDAEDLVRTCLAKIRPDLVHIHHWIRLTNNLAQIAAHLAVPSVITLHDLYSTCPRCFRLPPGKLHCELPLSVESCASCVPRWPWQSDEEIAEGIALYRETIRAELQCAGAVLVPHAVVAQAVSRFLDLPERIFRAPGFLSPARRAESPPPSPPPRTADGTLRIGCWGMISWRKGADTLLRALRMLSQDGGPSRPFECHFFGKIDEPALEERLRAMAQGLPVRFHGPYAPGEIAAAGLHLAVIPSPCFETYCFVLDEAFQMGLPVVVPRLGALDARAGRAGERYEPQSARDLRRVLASLIDSPGRLAELAAAIPAPPDPPEMHAENIEAIYREVIARGPAPRDRLQPEDYFPKLRHQFHCRETLFRRALSLLKMEEHVRNLEAENRLLRKELQSKRLPDPPATA